MTSWNELRKAATAFSKRWRNAFDEKSQAQSFLKEFFAVFGVDAVTVATFEHRVKFADGSQGYADCLWPGRILVEMKSRGKDLDAAFEQAMEYVRSLPEASQTPRAIVVSDFARIRFYDLANDCAMTEFALKDLRKYVTLFGFMIGEDGGTDIREQDPVNRRAAEKMARLHDAMKAVGYTGHPLEVYLVRLLFCLFAEDTGIFKPGQFSGFVAKNTAALGSDLAQQLAALFETLNTPPGRRLSILAEALADFPYVNGGLFAETLPIAAFSAEMRKALLDCSALDWSKISPAIFGAMFQGVMDEKARHDFGAHYTSEENILKLIRPLFLDGLRTEFEAICAFRGSPRKAKLEAFHEKIASLTFLDPACGCGNFLLIAYRELRRLEMDILEELYKDNPAQFLDISQLCKVSVAQFYGIEIEPFPAEIAKVALWLMDHLCNMEVADRFGQYFARIPIKDSPHIVCGNALRMDWQSILNAECTMHNAQCRSADGSSANCAFSFIMGNPPFNGARTMTPEAKRDLEEVFKGVKGAGNLDFVTAWFKKASDYMAAQRPCTVPSSPLATGHWPLATKAAFVATNSVSQGEQVPILWKNLDVEIDFAYRTFKWRNEAKGVAAVHCVMVGFHCRGAGGSPASRYAIYDSDGTAHPADHINAYLAPAPDAWIESRPRALAAPRPLIFGSMPNDGGFLSNWSPERRAEVVARWPEAAPLFHRLVGSDEPINGIERWCLWLKGVSPAAIRAVPPVMEAVAKVRELRLASNRAATRKLAATPMLFGEIRQPESGNYLLIPKVSSEKREYIPMAFFPADVIASDLALIVPGATLYDFGVLTSSVHMAWMRAVAGRLKSDYRYSAKIVYNNFPWPFKCKMENGECKMEDAGARTARPPILHSQFSIFNSICATAQMVIDARAAHPECTLADLYDPLAMPPDLRAAHEANDRAVLAAYGLKSDTPESEIVAHLFRLYAEAMADNR